LSLASLADIYIVKKQYVLAENLLFQANEILDNGNSSNEKKIVIYNKSIIFYFAIKKYDTAEKILKINTELCEKVYGKNHINTITNKGNLALIYFENKKFENAKKIYLELLNDKLESNSDFDLSLINNLALLYTELKHFSKSEDLYKKALKSIEVSDNKYRTSMYIIILENLTHLYYKLGKHKLMPNLIVNQIKLKEKQMIEFFHFFTESDLVNYIITDLKTNNFSRSFLQNYTNQYPSLNIAIYENQLLLKNLSLRNQQRIKTTIEKNGDANLKEKYQQFIDNKRYITKIEELPAAQRPASYNQLKIETESLEKELTRLSATFSEAKKSLSVSWKEIQEELKPNEVVIDLVSFNYYNNKWTDSIMYGAFVIKKDSKFPKFINLFEEKQLSVLLNRNNKAHDSIQSKIINKQYSDKEISDLFYKPLEAELKNGNTIYLAPSGLAHQINFKALPINDNQTLGEKFKVILLGTTAALFDYKPIAFNKTNDFEIILYGGIDYDKKEVEIKKETYPNELNDLTSRSGIKEFRYLKGTVGEVKRINEEAQKYKFTATIKTEIAATEESVKKLSGKVNPFILHLATHGYFFENIKQELSDYDKNIPEEAKKRIYLASEDPMMRSGLLLAGANNSWGKTNNETNADDGILTAKEIANLDLSSCKLVVLSACETGLGQINGSEGVFGLQRAFKMAGVQNIIMSLWKVPDAQTAELFEIFYTECFNGKSITDAFQLAQSKMKAKYPPYFWAGFVLLE
jgi:CHAT domain-containing protein